MRLPLRALEAQLVRRVERGFIEVASTSEAEGLFLLCPACFTANGGTKGTHSVLCWSPAVPQSVTPSGGRWQLVGTTLDDLTLVAGSSSVWLREAACRAHFFVRAGHVEQA